VRAHLCAHNSYVAKKNQGTLRAVEIYIKSFSRVLKKFLYKYDRLPFIFCRECGTALGKGGANTITVCVGGNSPRRFPPCPNERSRAHKAYKA